MEGDGSCDAHLSLFSPAKFVRLLHPLMRRYPVIFSTRRNAFKLVTVHAHAGAETRSHLSDMQWWENSIGDADDQYDQYDQVCGR